MSKYTKEQIAFLRENAPGRRCGALTTLFNAHFGLNFTERTVHFIMLNHKIRNGMQRKGCDPKYTPAHIAFLRESVHGRTDKELQVLFENKFGLEVNLSAIKNLKVRYGLRNGLVGGRFEKGRAPENKGKKWDEFMSPEGQAASRKTTFSSGHKPKNYKPVGSERVDSYGYHWVKIKDPKTWRMKHVLVWESVNGKIPKGNCLVFLDGDKNNVSINNLRLIERATLVRLNQNGLLQKDASLSESGILVAQVLTQIGRRTEKKTSDS